MHGTCIEIKKIYTCVFVII